MLKPTKIYGEFMLTNGEKLSINALAEPAYESGPYGIEYAGTERYINNVYLHAHGNQNVDITCLVFDFDLQNRLLSLCA